MILVLALALSVASCGGSKSPTAPTQPQTVQVGGVWTVTQSLTGVTGGECFATLFQGSIGSTARGTMQITQAGSSLTATFTSDANGSSCTYQGTAGASSMALNLVSCTASDILGATCPNSTARRDIRILTAGINGNVSGSTATGTAAETYNVNVAGTTSAVGTLTLNSSFSATKR
jgi:hypothetical protein